MLSPVHQRQLKKDLDVWRQNNVQESTLEFARHIQTQLDHYKNKLEILQRNQDKNDADVENAIQNAKDQIQLFQELLAPLNLNSVTARQVYAPSCIGLLIRWPWFDLLTDWLRELVYVNRKGDPVSLEKELTRLIFEIPEMPPGKAELAFRVGRLTLYYSRPRLNSFPSVFNVRSCVHTVDFVD